MQQRISFLHLDHELTLDEPEPKDQLPDNLLGLVNPDNFLINRIRVAQLSLADDVLQSHCLEDAVLNRWRIQESIRVDREVTLEGAAESHQAAQ